MKSAKIRTRLVSLSLLLIASLYGSSAWSASDSCLSCHEDDVQARTLAHRAHGQLSDPRLPSGDAMCESCHGVSIAHADKPRENAPDRMFDTSSVLTADEQSAVCTNCHTGDHQKSWPVSEHASADVACTSCHNVHAVDDKVQNKLTQSAVCLGCHVEQKANAAKFSRHPVKEGVVACSDCHNTHGGKGPSMLKEFTVNETCTECHAEKRGPFLFEHEPVQDNCTNCHTPHGSIHDNLLIARLPQLCQQCHDDSSHRGYDYARPSVPNRSGPDDPFNESGYIIGKQCLSCHGEIHGSNHAAGGAYFE